MSLIQSKQYVAYTECMHVCPDGTPLESTIERPLREGETPSSLRPFPRPTECGTCLACQCKIEGIEEIYRSRLEGWKILAEQMADQDIIEALENMYDEVYSTWVANCSREARKTTTEGRTEAFALLEFQVRQMVALGNRLCNLVEQFDLDGDTWAAVIEVLSAPIDEFHWGSEDVGEFESFLRSDWFVDIFRDAAENESTAIEVSAELEEQFLHLFE
ncbi:hypothetical protein AB5N19_12339 [Seiridium cardinale]|uniref:Uncharacterized protein n=1 Tax=Seiridium cardinale TaxID=138064 RepID=A0ABR2XTL5_9PEZI